jgi:hypothetical protein
VDLFSKLCCSDDWKQGTVTASILATLGDYLADFKRMLEEAFFKRCAQQSPQCSTSAVLSCSNGSLYCQLGFGSA